MNQSFLCYMVVLNALWLLASPARGDEKSLLAEAVRANSSTVGTIHTLYARVNLKMTPAGKQHPAAIYSGEYWREPGLVRVREERKSAGDFPEATEFQQADGRQQSVIRIPGPEANSFAVSLLIANEWRPTISTDVWKLGLLGLPGGGTESKPPLSIGEAVNQMKVRSIAEESSAGRRLVRLTLDDGVGTYDVWLEPAVNWLIRRIVRHVPKTATYNDRRTEYTISDFAELEPGLFFPAKMTMNSEVNGKHTTTHEAELTDVQINRLREPPFPKGLPFHNGMAARDEIAGTTYMVDGQGRPSGKVGVLRYADAPVVPAQPTPSSDSRSGWLLRPSTWFIGLAVLLACSAAFLAYRRRRLRRAG